MPRTWTQGALCAAMLLLATACAETTPAPVIAAPTPAPAAAPPAATPPADPSRALPIFFEAWSAFLEEPAEVALREAAERAKQRPNLRILVTGFADPRGSREANVLLSRLRARMVADALIANGIPASRIRVTYRGPTPGFESLESRRVEVRVDRGQR